jgi:hypothetical protein
MRDKNGKLTASFLTEQSVELLSTELHVVSRPRTDGVVTTATAHGLEDDDKT